MHHDPPSTNSKAKSLRDSSRWVMDRRQERELVRGFLMNTDIQMYLPSSGGTGLKHFWNFYMEGLSEAVCELLPHPRQSSLC